MEKQSFCISWKNNRIETHSGPELWIQPAVNDYIYDLTDEGLDQIEEPRPKTYEEAQELADRMNDSLCFNNDTHEVVIYKGKKRADKPAPKAQLSRSIQRRVALQKGEVMPVFLLPKAKAGRPRKVSA